MNSFRKKPIVTYGLIAVNLLVFIGMTLSGGSQNVVNLIAWGAKYNPLIIQGELWRLFTPMFIHIGLEHLALNLLTLYFLGVQLEQLFGKWRFLALYLISGVGGNILMLGESFRQNQYIRMISRQFLVLIVLNLGFDLFAGGIDIWGHLGGLLAGFLASYAVGVPNIGSIPRIKRIISVVALVVVYGLLLQTGFNHWQYPV